MVSSTSTTGLFPASLLPKSAHDPLLLQFLSKPTTPNVISFVARELRTIIAVKPEPSDLPTPPLSPIKTTFDLLRPTPLRPTLPVLETFIKLLMKNSGANVGTLLTAMVYLGRLRKVLPPGAKGMPCTPHRVVMSTLVIAGKYLHDCCPRNKHWRGYVEDIMIFKRDELNLMEIQMLELLDFNLRITQEDVDKYFMPFLPQQVTELSELVLSTNTSPLDKYISYHMERAANYSGSSTSTLDSRGCVTPVSVRKSSFLQLRPTIYDQHNLQLPEVSLSSSGSLLSSMLSKMMKRSLAHESEQPNLKKSSTMGNLLRRNL